PWLDLLYQLLSIAFTLTPVALVVLLLALTAGSLRQALRDLGLDPGRRLRDLRSGVLLTAGVGLPGLAIYYLGRLLAAPVEVSSARRVAPCWTLRLSVLHAVKNAVLEEVIVVGCVF